MTHHVDGAVWVGYLSLTHLELSGIWQAALNFPPLSFVCCLTNRSAALCIDCRVIIR